MSCQTRWDGSKLNPSSGQKEAYGFSPLRLRARLKARDARFPPKPVIRLPRSRGPPHERPPRESGQSPNNAVKIPIFTRSLLYDEMAREKPRTSRTT
jgi:hypothetical protein